MVGKIFTAHRATFGQLDMKKTLKVVGRFIHNDAEGMKRIFVKAEAKIKAKGAVLIAIQDLDRASQFRTLDLRFLDLIITTARGSATDEQRDNPDFRVALFDAAWKESAGRGTLNIILKKSGGSVDGTKFLKSDLHRLAKAGDLERLEAATELAVLLEAIKKHAHAPTTDTKEKNLTDVPAAIALLRKLGAKHAGTSGRRRQAVQKPLDDIESTALSDLLGKALTESLNPKIKLASQLDAAKDRPEFERSYEKLSYRTALKMFREFFELFSSEKMWSRDEVKVSLYEYYGLALNIVALEKLRTKQNITKQDIALLKTTLKGPLVVPGFAEEMEVGDQSRGAGSISNALEELNKIVPNQDAEKVLDQMSRICAKYYIDGEILNLTAEERLSVQAAIETATTAAGVIDALKDAFGKVLKGTQMDSERFFKPVRDLTTGSA